MLEITFGALHNYRCEILYFKVVPFSGVYDAVLVRTSFAMFMATPCYAYMKLKMSGPYDIIMINSAPCGLWRWKPPASYRKTHNWPTPAAG